MSRFVPLLVCLTLTACAARATDPHAASPQDVVRACEPVGAPEALPDPAVLVDLDGLKDSILEYWTGRSLDEGQILLTLRYVDGLNIRRDVVAHDVGAVAADSVQRLVFAHLREVASETALPEEMDLRLRIAVSDSVGVATERSVYCPVQVGDFNLARAIGEFDVRRPRVGVMERRPRRVRVQAIVDSSGHVREVRMLSGPPLTTDMQHRVLRYLQQYRFEPAHIDGHPVAGTIVVPLRVRGT